MYGGKTKDYKDSCAFSLGAIYDFGIMKLYAAGMYFFDMQGINFLGYGGLQSLWTTGGDGFENATNKGYSLLRGADVPYNQD